MTKKQIEKLKILLEVGKSCRKNNIKSCEISHEKLGMCTFKTFDNMILIHKVNTRWRSLKHFIQYSC